MDVDTSVRGLTRLAAMFSSEMQLEDAGESARTLCRV